MGERSLVLFTLLTQAAVGALVALVGTQLLGSADVLGFAPFLVVGLLVLVAATISTLHLGSPTHAPYAITNLGASWLSREILGLGLTGGLVAVGGLVALVADRAGSEAARTGVGALAAAAGTFLLLAMVRLYSLRTIPEWRPSRVALEFSGSTLRLGAPLGAALASVGLLPEGSAGMGAIWPLLLLVGGVGLWYLGRSARFGSAGADRRAGALLVRGPSEMSAATRPGVGPQFAAGAIAATAGAGVLSVGPAWLAGLLSLAGLLALVSDELAARNRFYESAPERGRDVKRPAGAPNRSVASH